MKSFKQLKKEYNQGLIDLDDLFLEWGSYEIKAVKLVRHIENHIKQMSPEEKNHGKVMCKVCGKTIDEIDKEEFL